MRCWVALVVAAVALTLVACGGGSHSTSPTAATSSTGIPTGPALPTLITRATPANFEDAVAASRNILDAIGVNIGAVPPDVRKQILAQCRDLARFADQKKVTDLCSAVERSMNTGDFGLLDQVITQLGQLKKK